MSLQSCPTCGYAVSTTTLKCRHCLASHGELSVSTAGVWFNKYRNIIIGIVLTMVSLVFGVYLILHIQKGGAF